MRGGGTCAGLPAVGGRPELPLTALGLDSVSAARLAARVKEATGVAPDPVSLLEPRPLRELAAALSPLAAHPRAFPSPAAAGAAGEGEEPFSVSAGQNVLWFLHRLAPESAAYNLAAAVGVHGPLDPNAVSASLAQVVARHAALRTVVDEDEPVQRVLARFDLALQVRDTAPGALRETLDAEACRPFRFDGAPPACARSSLAAGRTTTCSCWWRTTPCRTFAR